MSVVEPTVTGGDIAEQRSDTAPPTTSEDSPEQIKTPGSPPLVAPDEDADTDENEDEREDEPEDAYAQGERLAAMVDAEEARAEAEEDKPKEVPTVPPPDPYTRQCPTCKGFGSTQTGSIVEGQEFRECPTCQGRGWQERLEASAVPADVDMRVTSDDSSWKWG